MAALLIAKESSLLTSGAKEGISASVFRTVQSLTCPSMCED